MREFPERDAGLRGCRTAEKKTDVVALRFSRTRKTEHDVVGDTESPSILVRLDSELCEQVKERSRMVRGEGIRSADDVNSPFMILDSSFEGLGSIRLVQVNDAGPEESVR